MPEYVEQPGSGAAVKEREKVEQPRKYKVVLLNDDYTTMDFVMLVLESVFKKSGSEAYRIMMHVHENGRGIAGVYVKSVAELKAETVHELARAHEYPLRCTIEPE